MQPSPRKFWKNKPTPQKRILSIINLYSIAALQQWELWRGELNYDIPTSTTSSPAPFEFIKEVLIHEWSTET